MALIVRFLTTGGLGTSFSAHWWRCGECGAMEMVVVIAHRDELWLIAIQCGCFWKEPSGGRVELGGSAMCGLHFSIADRQ